MAGARVSAIYSLLLVAIWLAMSLLGLAPHDPRWALEPHSGVLGLWRLGSYAFVHDGLLHLAGNLAALWLAGRPLERMIGSRATAGLLVLGALVAALVFVVSSGVDTAVGASGAVMAVAGAALVVLARRWRELAWRARLRLASPLFLFAAVAAFAAFGPIQLAIPLGVGWLELTLAAVPVPPLVHVVHLVALAAGAVAAMWLLAPRVLPVACAVIAAGAAAVALARPAPPAPFSEASLARCQSGDRDLCRRLVAVLTPSCRDGSEPLSCHNIGFFLENGLTGSVDLAGAAEHYRRGCDGGFAGACVNLAVMHLTEQLPPDPVLTREASRRACAGGLAQGCNFEGIHLMEGRGGPVDLAGARRAFVTACGDDFPLACRNLGLLLWNADEREAAIARFAEACTGGDRKGCELREQGRAELAGMSKAAD